MRHRKSGHKLSMDSSQRKALYRNMVTSLFLYGQIRTTETRAKELRRVAERLLSIGKRAPSAASLAALKGAELTKATGDRVAAFRRIREWVENDEALGKVMGEYADRFRSRPGGYTRVLKLGSPRPGDKAPMAVIQLVEAYEHAGAAPAEGDDKAKKKRAPRKKKTEAEAPAVETAGTTE